MKAIALFLLLTLVSVAAEPFAAVGTWEIKHTDGTPIYLILTRDGEALSDWDGGDPGSWRWEGNQLVLDWDSGWRDVITRKADGSFEKVACGPDASRSGPPTNRTTARKL